MSYLPPQPPEHVMASVEVAREALDDANRRREVALRAAAEFALRALMEGADVDKLIEACGFKAPEPRPSISTFGLWSPPTLRESFAEWLCSVVRELALGDEASGRRAL